MKASDWTARFAALGGIATVAVTQPDALSLARATVERIVAEFDLACSRFRSDSELAVLNRAEGAAVRVSPLFLEALQAGLRAARLTDGDVDPTLGNALIALGYDRDFAAPQARTDGPATLARPQISPITVAGWRTVVLDARAGTVRLPPGVTLDLGATAKALAADHAAQSAHEAAGCGVLVSLSGDMSIAGPSPPSGWRVRVTDDHRSGFDAPGQSVALRSGGLATSSTTVRRWRHHNVEAHHLLDPATGRPAAVGWRTVTVAAARCLDANIATTAAIVRGTRAQQWLESLRLPSRLVAADGTVTHAGGWPEDGEESDHGRAVASIDPDGQDLR
jgi:FAD:protein FMN transferase